MAAQIAWLEHAHANAHTLLDGAQMLVDPAETVILLPAATRYEIPGGITQTSTERRIMFSPEIKGPRIGEARPEWEVYLDLARRVRASSRS